MSATKGSVVVADGTGKVTVVSPTSDTHILVVDKTTAAGAKFIDIRTLLPLQRLKSTAGRKNFTNLTVYTKILEMYIPGDKIQAIKVVSYKDAAVSSYQIRALNAADSTIIAEATFTNNTPAVNDLGPVSNLSTDGIIELLIKRTGGVGRNNNAYLVEATVELTI